MQGLTGEFLREFYKARTASRATEPEAVTLACGGLGLVAKHFAREPLCLIGGRLGRIHKVARDVAELVRKLGGGQIDGVHLIQ